MRKTIITRHGRVSVGDRIRIIGMKDSTQPSPAFPDGVDHQARDYANKEGTVTCIDSMGQIHGSWGGLAVVPEEDEFEIIEHADSTI